MKVKAITHSQYQSLSIRYSLCSILSENYPHNCLLFEEVFRSLKSNKDLSNLTRLICIIMSTMEVSTLVSKRIFIGHQDEKVSTRRRNLKMLIASYPIIQMALIICNQSINRSIKFFSGGLSSKTTARCTRESVDVQYVVTSCNGRVKVITRDNGRQQCYCTYWRNASSHGCLRAVLILYGNDPPAIYPSRLDRTLSTLGNTWHHK